MKLLNESIFMNSLRAFFVSLFGTMGALLGLILVVILSIVLVSSTEDKRSFPSNVKVLPDHKGSRKELASSTPTILEIAIEGVIGCDPTTSEKIEEVLLDSREESFKNDRIKAILLNINSPGGGATESDTIYRLIKAYKKQYNLPVFAYVNGLCASGGYYIACAADKIFASPSCIIGSVGVINWPPYLNVTELMEKIGVKSLTLSAGKGKDLLNPTRPWTDDEGASRQTLINYFYQDFVDVVSANRPQISEDDLKKIYGADVFATNEALEKGYIDAKVELKREAILALAQEAKIEDNYQVVCFKTKSWWKEIMSEKNLFRHEFSLKPGLNLNSTASIEYR
jgi:protease-4